MRGCTSYLSRGKSRSQIDAKEFGRFNNSYFMVNFTSNINYYAPLSRIPWHGQAFPNTFRCSLRLFRDDEKDIPCVTKHS